jgi:mersacidin/lichenicidin family type 2 lantibiotic
MADIDIVRAWKDAKYRRSLTDQQRAALPANPAGMVELSDQDLQSAAGLSGASGGNPPITTAINCTLYSFGGWKACGCGIGTTAPTCTAFTFQGWAACCPY